jgi:hypothetical protein
MNFPEFIQLKGQCKTAAGHPIHNLRITNDPYYPISGTIEWPNQYLTPLQWDTQGNPINLPLNHGLHLIAMVPRIEYDKIDISKLDTIKTPTIKS